MSITTWASRHFTTGPASERSQSQTERCGKETSNRPSKNEFSQHWLTKHVHARLICRNENGSPTMTDGLLFQMPNKWLHGRPQYKHGNRWQMIWWSSLPIACESSSPYKAWIRDSSMCTMCEPNQRCFKSRVCFPINFLQRFTSLCGGPWLQKHRSCCCIWQQRPVKHLRSRLYRGRDAIYSIQCDNLYPLMRLHGRDQFWAPKTIAPQNCCLTCPKKQLYTEQHVNSAKKHTQ